MLGARHRSHMHICFNALDYPSHLGGGGVGNQVQILARALVGAGHRVSVVALAKPGLPDFTDDHGVRVYRVRCGNWHWYLSKVPLVGRVLILPVRELERSLATFRQIRAIHRTDPIDLIEGIETGMFGVARWLPLVPVVIRLHGEPYTFTKYTPGMERTAGLCFGRLFQRAALRRARLLIAPSLAHASEIATELGHNRPPIEVVPNALSPEMGCPSLDFRATEAVEGPIILYVGRLERGKGIPTLLAASRHVLAAVGDARLVLAGSLHPSLPCAELDTILEQLPYRDRILLLGHVPWRDLFNWYRRAAVCVLPSHYETFGLAALEPMAFGVPVVATRAGGLPEIIDHGVNGLLVRSGDTGELADAIIRLLKDQPFARRLGENGHRRALRDFQVTTHLSRNLDLYHWVRCPRGRDGQSGPLRPAATGVGTCTLAS